MAEQFSRRCSLFIAVALVVLLTLPIAYLVMGQAPLPTNDPARALKSYLRAVYARDYRSAYQWLSTADRKSKSEEDYLRENPSFSGAALELTRRLAQMIEFRNIKRQIRDDQAMIRFTARLPDAGNPSLQRMLMDFDPDRLARLSREELESLGQELESMKVRRSLPMIEGEESLELIRENDRWKVFVNWAGATRIRFRAEVKAGLPWDFEPVQETILAKPGETLQALYRARNRSDRPVTAKARHLDEPKDLAGKYLKIVQCFCFIQETLAAGEEKELPLVLRLDWDLPDEVREFQVTYQFYPVESFPEG